MGNKSETQQNAMPEHGSSVQDMLLDTQALFRQIFDEGPIGMALVGQDFKFIKVNVPFCKMLEYSANELTALTFADVTHPGHISVDKENALKLLREEQLKYYTEKRYITKSGKIVWASSAISAIRDAQGKFICFLAIVEDITEKKRVEAELQSSEQRFRSLIEHAPAAVGMSRNGFTVYANYRYLKMFGFESVDEIAGKPLIDQIAPQCREEILKWVRERSSTEKSSGVSELETIGLRKDGTEFPFFVAITRMDLDEGPAEMGVFINIAERKRAEEVLRQSEAQLLLERQLLQTIINTIPVMITIYDPETMHFQVNKEVEKVLGWTNEEVQRIDLLEAAYPDPEDRKKNMECMKSLSPGWHDMTMTAKDGTPIVSSWANMRLPDDRQVGIGLDMRERRRAEDQLRRNEYELRTLINNSPDLIVRFDKHMRYVYANPAYERIAGIPQERLTGKTNHELGMPKDKMRYWESAARKVFESGREESVEIYLTSFFGKRYFWGKIVPEFAKDGSVETVMTISRDITERKMADEKIRFISFHDEVTGLFNRAFFEEEIRRLDAERELPISLIMGDVNNLKLTNDAFGHDEGDKLLKRIASIVKASCRHPDVIARWGGDEFTVILPKTAKDVAEEVVRRIQQVCSGVQDMALQPSIALGIGTKESRDENIYQVLREAESRMYKNKAMESRRNQDIMISALLRLINENGYEAEGHRERIKELSAKMGSSLGLSEKQKGDLYLISGIHDIGKITIAADVLKSPRRLSPEEWAEAVKHVEAGYRMVRSINVYSHLSEILLTQHERWDGKGYPRGLNGEEIPLLARIFSIIDAYDVMTHARPYARTFSEPEALEELKRNAGTQFDPEFVKGFVENLQEMREGESVPVRS